MDIVTAKSRRPLAILAVAALALIAGAFLAPGVPFIVDGGVYLDMAASLADHHTLAVGGNGGVEGAPALTKHLTVARGTAVMPQYPSGYAFLAAPFYAAFGAHGLMLMNALAFALCIWMTRRLATILYSDDLGLLAALLFALATFAPTYMFGVWPQMLALGFYLGAITLAAESVKGDARGWRMLFLSGLVVGLGVNVRIDIFLAGIAIFFWLRLFARPKDRIAPLMLLFGAAPGFLLAAWLNDLKFGAFTPFAYGDDSGLDSAGRYLPLAAAGAALTVVLWTLNAPALFDRAISRPYRRYSFVAFGVAAIAILALTPLRDFAWRMIKGGYVLVINLQAHDAYYQEGVERNEFGQLMFWNYPKKALIQSIPWLPLSIIPIWSAIRGRAAKATTLCFLAAAAPIAFYSMNQWHGGGSYSLRYFLPALPFLAILAMNGFQTLRGSAAIKRETLLVMLFVAGSLYLGLQEFGHAQIRWLAPASLYPQWLIALALAVALAGALAMEKAAFNRTAIMISLFAFAYATALNLYEEISHERTRAEQEAMAQDISAPIPEGALVLTTLQTTLIPAEAHGAYVMAAKKRWAAAGAKAAMAFQAAGRCVYFQNSLAVSLIEDSLPAPIDMTPLWAPSVKFASDPRLAFFTLKDAPAKCRVAFLTTPLETPAP